MVYRARMTHKYNEGSRDASAVSMLFYQANSLTVDEMKKVFLFFLLSRIVLP